MELDFTTVSRHEAGERKPSKRDLERYAALYKVSTYELFLSPASVTAG